MQQFFLRFSILAAVLNLASCAGENLTVVEEVVPLAKEEAVPDLIAGKYVVTSTQRGKMSWYSVKTNGGTTTASGKPFRNDGATAAHRKLSFGTKVRVTNLGNGKSEIITITDRGPYIDGRIIDVSIGTARKLDFVNDGVVSCKVEVLGEP